MTATWNAIAGEIEIIVPDDQGLFLPTVGIRQASQSRWARLRDAQLCMPKENVQVMCRSNLLVLLA